MACEPPPKRSKKEVTEHGDDILESYMAKRKEVCKSVTDFKFNKKRVRLISSDADIPENCRGIAYWMWREQRVQGWFKPPGGGGGHFWNFWVGMCRWEPGTRNRYQS